MIAADTKCAVQPHRTVVTCYSVLDRFFPACGLFDLNEGIYAGDPDLELEQAQANQHRYLLDQLHCGPGSRILDIGCGYGTLLARAQRRGAQAIGITVSTEQARRGQRAGLDVRLLDYRDLEGQWPGAFDGIVANGSAEHFVQPADALAGRADGIYRQFFRLVHRLMNPLERGRLVTTAIHYVQEPDPADLLRKPRDFPHGSPAFHYALLARSFGGWYPTRGQLECCAAGYFTLTDEVDGTDDYHRTSEAWLQRVRRVLRSKAGAGVLLGSLPAWLRQPRQFTTMLYCMLVSESWNWQFRTPNPPTRLLRQTWRYVPQRGVRSVRPDATHNKGAEGAAHGFPRD